MPVLQIREIEVPMQFACGGCGFSAPVVVRARGLATGAFSGGGLSARAQRDALSNAQMRCELAPCPRCARRSFATFRRALVKNLLWVPGAIGILLVGQYVTDSSVFKGHYVGVAVALYASIAVLLFGWIGTFMVLEVRNAARKVRFPAS